jgi:hypothetical protein
MFLVVAILLFARFFSHQCQYTKCSRNEPYLLALAVEAQDHCSAVLKVKVKAFMDHACFRVASQGTGAVNACSVDMPMHREVDFHGSCLLLKEHAQSVHSYNREVEKEMEGEPKCSAPYMYSSTMLRSTIMCYAAV